MTDADKAYDAAQRLIAEAKEQGTTHLSFDTAETHALTRLPPEIAALSALRILDLRNTQITDLQPLTALTGLTALSLGNTQISNLKLLTALTGLTQLYLDNTPITDLQPLTALTGLIALSLGYTPITDLQPLMALTGMTTLLLNHTQISDLQPLTALTGLTTLSLGSTQITDLQPLAALTGLTTLWLDNTQITDLRPLRNLQGLVENPKQNGLTFTKTPATRAAPRIAEIAAIEDPANRARELFAYLRPSSIEAALQGPILSDALTDVTKPVDRFEATALTDTAERPIDRRHDQLLETAQIASQMLGRVETQNRIGRDVAESLSEYARFALVSPTNPRLLNYLANSVRAAIVNPETAASLDAFDNERILGFLAEHDALIREYYTAALAGPSFEAETAPAVLLAELFPKLASAKQILQEADQAGLFAPSVSDALEMLHRRAEGAKRVYLTSGDPAEREQATKELRRNSVLVTAYLGRITGRVTQWIETQRQKPIRDHADDALRLAGLLRIAEEVVTKLKPVFEALWHMIGNLRLPF